jgi:hypothetical protein
MSIKDDEPLERFRKQVEEMYHIPAGSFLISHVHDMLLTSLYNSQAKVRDSISLQGGVILLH